MWGIIHASFFYIFKEVFCMASRTGLPTLIKLATKMCIIIVRFTPVITTLYGGNAALMAALAAANAACAELVNQVSLVVEPGD
jgi:hypothetical protein